MFCWLSKLWDSRTVTYCESSHFCFLISLDFCTDSTLGATFAFSFCTRVRTIFGILVIGGIWFLYFLFCWNCFSHTLLGFFLCTFRCFSYINISRAFCTVIITVSGRIIWVCTIVIVGVTESKLYILNHKSIKNFKSIFNCW